MSNRIAVLYPTIVTRRNFYAVSGEHSPNRNTAFRQTLLGLGDRFVQESSISFIQASSARVAGHEGFAIPVADPKLTLRCLAGEAQAKLWRVPSGGIGIQS